MNLDKLPMTVVFSHLNECDIDEVVRPPARHGGENTDLGF